VRRLLPPRFRVWTLVTAGFAESSLFLVRPRCDPPGSATAHGHFN